MKEFFNKHLERVVLVGVALALVVFIGGGVYLQKQNNQKEKTPAKDETTIPKEVKLKVSSSAQTESQGNSGEGGTPASGTVSFFLEPSPEQLLSELENMVHLNEDVVNKKFLKLRVLWPVYFFSFQPMEEGPYKLIVDVSPDGFGVIVETVVNLVDFPPLNFLQQGDKIWIGGEILGVDPSGTGTIYLDTEHVSLGEEVPSTAVKERLVR